MKVLIAEDDVFYRSMLESMLADWGYELIVVDNGFAAWDELQKKDAPKLAILDWVMPGFSGPELCRKVRALRQPEPTYMLILTTKQETVDKVAALEDGADDYLTKPFDAGELRARLNVGQRVVGLQTSQAVVYALAQAVEAKSPYTRGHSDRVTGYALLLAERLALSEREREELRRGSILHDIGKISIPDAILDKPDQLTPEEFEIVKRHPVDGAKMIESLESVRDLIPLVRWHHERMDGRGYPDGLRAGDLPIPVRVLAVADVYDALSSARPYRGALSYAKCLEILQENAAHGGLDSDLVHLFCSLPQSELKSYQIERNSSVFENPFDKAKKPILVGGSCIVPSVK